MYFYQNMQQSYLYCEKVLAKVMVLLLHLCKTTREVGVVCFITFLFPVTEPAKFLAHTRMQAHLTFTFVTATPCRP